MNDSFFGRREARSRPHVNDTFFGGRETGPRPHMNDTLREEGEQAPDLT